MTLRFTSEEMGTLHKMILREQATILDGPMQMSAKAVTLAHLYRIAEKCGFGLDTFSPKGLDTPT